MKGLPPMQSSRAQAKFLALQCKLMRVKNVLEVGTLGAFASIYIATENPDCKITTIEFNPKHAEVARENIAHAGVGDRVEVLVGSAVDILPDLLKDIEDGKRERFGARKAIEEVGKDERVDGVVMQIVSEKNWDGFLMTVVKYKTTTIIIKN
ncbi:O-methyltransferase family 3 protein [Rutstroemia sp. NJR-2017a BBW]|nr:O-methyltransferase family 3 protein [Rutstroemia sp. NJR-2017a BBW]